jgi:hypothetical protein
MNCDHNRQLVNYQLIEGDLEVLQNWIGVSLEINMK